MEELVYQFLLQTAHYPRASIVSDTTMLFQNADTHPTFVVVDPENAKPLAAIHVVGPVNADGLYAASAAANQNARSLKPAVAQGFVVRIDFKGRTESEKVQFYCAKDKGELYPLTAASFPDLDSLRVYAKLNSKQYISAGGVAVMGGHVAGVTSTDAANNGSKIMPFPTAATARRTEFTDEELLGLDEEVDAQTVSTAADNFDFNVRSKYRSGFWLGLLLLVLAIGDAVALRYTGQSLVQITHVVLLVGAVLAFLL